MMFVNKIPSIIILFLLVLCLILLAILISTSESYIFILAQLILDKLKRFMIIITFEIQSLMLQSWITSFHVIRQCIVLHHDRVCVWVPLRGLSSVPIIAGAIGLPLLISLVVEFSYITLIAATKPRLSCALQPHDWVTRSALVSSMCDITHCNPLLCNLTSVLTSDPYSSV